MATSTFDKRIILGKEAADRLVAQLNEPPIKAPDLSELEKQEEINWQNFLKRSRKLSQTEMKTN